MTPPLLLLWDIDGTLLQRASVRARRRDAAGADRGARLAGARRPSRGGRGPHRRRRSRATCCSPRATRRTAIDARADDVIARLLRALRRAVPGRPLARGVAPGVAERARPAGRTARRVPLLARDRQLRADRAAQARAGGDRRLVPGRPGRASAPTPRTASCSRRSPGARRGRLAARAHGRHRRHAARHRVRAGGRAARRGGRDGPVRAWASWRTRTRWWTLPRRSCRSSRTGLGARTNGGWVEVRSEPPRRPRMSPQCHQPIEMHAGLDAMTLVPPTRAGPAPLPSRR